MRDIYEVFNEINIDDDELIEVEVDELERRRVKKKLKSTINKRRNKKKSVAVAASIISMIFLGGLSSYTEDIPIVDDIFKVFSKENEGFYDQYKNNSTKIGVTVEDKWTAITINEGVFDGHNIDLTFTIKSNKDLGENISLLDKLKVKGYEKSGGTGQTEIKKVDENTYVGHINYSLFNFTGEEESIDVDLNIKGVTDIELNKDVIRGKWNFKLKLKNFKERKLVDVESYNNDDIMINFGKLEITKTSMFLSYNQIVSRGARDYWSDIEVEIEVRDDLGNSYIILDNGVEGDDKLNKTYRKTISAVKEESKKLYITPIVTYKKLREVNKKEERNFVGETFELVERKEEVLKTIEVNLI